MPFRSFPIDTAVSDNHRVEDIRMFEPLLCRPEQVPVETQTDGSATISDDYWIFSQMISQKKNNFSVDLYR